MELKNQQVLVTGSMGLVGNNLLERLIVEGAKIRATWHKKEPIVNQPGIEYVRGDLTSEEDCHRAVQGIRFLFHCAANTSGAAVTINSPMDHVTPNVVMNARLLEAAYNANVEKFMWLSSTTGYPLSGDRPVKEEEIFDGEPFHKYFFVGWMKRYCEILCLTYGEKLPRRMTTIVLRPTNIYGPGDDFEPATSHSTAALIRKVVDRQNPIEVWGDGQDTKDLIYIDDLVEAMVRGMEKIESYTAMNIGSGQGFSINQVLEEILKIDGYEDSKVIYDPTKPTVIPIRLVDISKARSLIGFDPKTNLSDGLKKTISWYRQSRNLLEPAGVTSPD